MSQTQPLGRSRRRRGSCRIIIGLRRIQQIALHVRVALDISYLESRHLAANAINQQLAAVRRLAQEAADAGLLSPELAAGIGRVRGVKQLGFRSGNWLSPEQSSEVLKHACGDTRRAKRDYAMLAMLFGRFS